MGRKTLAVAALTAVTALTATACTGAAATKGESAAAATDPGKVSGTITVLTHRTDLVQNGTLNKYAAAFNKIYPKVTVKFDGITDYEGEVKIRMNTDNYGDVLMIPNANHGYGAASNYMMRRRWDYFVKWLLSTEPPKEVALGARR